MEPPKKRKYPEHLDTVSLCRPLVSSVTGACASLGVAMEAEQTGGGGAADVPAGRGPSAARGDQR